MTVTAPSNADLAELLSREAQAAPRDSQRRRALGRAARRALVWPQEARDLVAEGGSPTDLPSVGPFIGALIEGWLADPPEIGERPPERTGFLTVARARRILAERPEWRKVRADLQIHTTWSDGKLPLEDMAEAIRARGHEHAAITDHSKGLPIARGMHEERLLEQVAAIDRWNETAGDGLVLLRGLEMNLSPAGEGDMDPEVLRRLDLVLGAFHSRLRVTDDQTARYRAALRNPDVHVLAHPRGRRFGARRGLQADWEVVVAEAARTGTALEVDAHPDRQDLDVSILQVAAETDVWVSVGTDAHRPEELEHLELGLAALALAGFRPDRVLNRLPREDLLAWAGRA